MAEPKETLTLLPEQRVKVLFFSEMTVSPGSGGGHTLFNLLEPVPEGCELLYATPTSFPAFWAPFPEISSRICWVSNEGKNAIPIVRRGRSYGAVRGINNLIASTNSRLSTEKAVRQILEHIRRHRIEVLLASPQSIFDLIVTVKVLQRSGIPAVTWFMDNYFTDPQSVSYLRELWERSRQRFVISEAMGEFFARSHSGDCEVLNNSVPFPPRYPEPSVEAGSPLRVIYAGSLNSYYLETVRSLLDELKDLGEEIVLDIYSHEELPSEFSENVEFSYRHFPSIPADQIRERLQQYDLLLMLSSFQAKHRTIAETSLASKWADYLASGRAILVYGPEYAENVRYAERYDFAAVVTSNAPGSLRNAMASLSADRKRLRDLGERAYLFGRERHNKVINSARLWDALLQATGRSNHTRNKKIFQGTTQLTVGDRQ